MILTIEKAQINAFKRSLLNEMYYAVHILQHFLTICNFR